MQKRVLNVVGSVLMGLVCLTMAVACEGGKSKPARDVRPHVEDRIGIDAMKSRGYAVKLKVEDSLIVVYSRKGRNVRLDKFSGQDHTVLLFAPGGGQRNEWVYAAGKGWHKDEYRTEQNINNFFAEIITDQADVCLRHGYEPAGTVTVCDKLCAVYKGVFMADAGEKAGAVRSPLMRDSVAGEFAVWNGLTLYLKCDGRVMSECLDVKVGVPDDAFTQTLDVTWME